MIDIAIARACIKSLADGVGAHILEPGDPGVEFALTIAEGIATLVPGGLPVLSGLLSIVRQATEKVSVAFPAPGGPRIIFSQAAIATGRTYFATGMHELVHVTSHILRVGALQSGIDYLGSSELRAEREAEASAVGMWASFIVSGERPDPEDAAILRSALYHLDPPDKDFARGVVKSVLGSIEGKALPPFSIATNMLEWLRKNAPETILVSDYR